MLNSFRVDWNIRNRNHVHKNDIIKSSDHGVTQETVHEEFQCILKKGTVYVVGTSHQECFKLQNSDIRRHRTNV